jgi:CRP/FNR family cyclic AMP-dependent transcriptional regulator
MDEARLRSVPLFASLSKNDLARVARHADEIDLPAGRELVKEGAFAYELFAIEQGTAEVRRGDERINELGPGDFFGEIGVMSSGRRTASVITTSPMTAVVMTASDFRALSKDMPDVVSKIRSAIEERTRDVASG